MSKSEITQAQGMILAAIIALVGVVISAVLNYYSNVNPINIQIRATQTVQAEQTQQATLGLTNNSIKTTSEELFADASPDVKNAILNLSEEGFAQLISLGSSISRFTSSPCVTSLSELYNRNKGLAELENRGLAEVSTYSDSNCQNSYTWKWTDFEANVYYYLVSSIASSNGRIRISIEEDIKSFAPQEIKQVVIGMPEDSFLFLLKNGDKTNTRSGLWCNSTKGDF